MQKKKVIVFILCAIFATIVHAQGTDLKFMIEPNYPPQQAHDVYKPLADYLSKSIGRNVTLVVPRNYHFFWRDVRNNVPVDLMFAEAHITDYRIQRFQVEPLARIAENTSYTLLASDQLENPTLKSLVGRNIITMPSPSLGFALLVEFYPDIVLQPNVLSSAASWNDGVDIIFDGSADGAIVPTWLQDQYPNLIPIKTSREFPGTAICAANSLDAELKQKITDALLKLHEDPALFDVLNALNITKFVPATAKEYRGSESVLHDLFGYQPVQK